MYSAFPNRTIPPHLSSDTQLSCSTIVTARSKAHPAGIIIIINAQIMKNILLSNNAKREGFWFFGAADGKQDNLHAEATQNGN